MDLSTYTTKDVGNLGETIASRYLKRNGFKIVERNVARKTGEIDIIAERKGTLHFVEVKSLLCDEFPEDGVPNALHNPADNIHEHKVRKISRTAEWYTAEKGWKGPVQIDAILVWLRTRDALAKVRYLPQIL